MITVWLSRAAIGIDNDEKIAGLAKIRRRHQSRRVKKPFCRSITADGMVDPQLIGGRQPVAPSALAAPRRRRCDAACALSGEEV
ncbi:Uncharacterised protein [Raoultella planticola]|uniref:Uncharacterized protein n=1 Tax=Raoultella planticola TaxID=575 RepID=A0A485CT25_RAOPL|nr:Uncharacterised protein [Raoultella planticola]